MTQEEFQTELRVYALRRYGSLTKMAEAIEVSVQYLSAIARGVKKPSRGVLQELGYSRKVTVTYRKA